MCMPAAGGGPFGPASVPPRALVARSQANPARRATLLTLPPSAGVELPDRAPQPGSDPATGVPPIGRLLQLGGLAAGIAPGVNRSASAARRAETQRSATAPLVPSDLPQTTPRSDVPGDARSDGRLILKQVSAGTLGAADAMVRFEELLSRRGVTPAKRQELNLSFGENLARAVRRRFSAHDALRELRRSDVSPSRNLAQPAERDADASIRARSVGGLEVLDTNVAPSGAAAGRALGPGELRPDEVVEPFDDEISDLGRERLEQLKIASVLDPIGFRRRIAATIVEAMGHAQAERLSNRASSPTLYRRHIARAFGFAIAASSLTGDQTFIDAVLSPAADLPAVGAFRGLANVGRGLLAENGGVPLTTQTIANQVGQVFAQQLNLEAGTQVGASDPLAALLGIGGASIARGLGAGIGARGAQSRAGRSVGVLRPFTLTHARVVEARARRRRLRAARARQADGPVNPNEWTKPYKFSSLFSGSTTGDHGSLRKNMLADKDLGLPDDDTWQAHHIVPWRLRRHRLILRLGMNMNNSQNGLALPRFRGGNLSEHEGSHDGYDTAFKEIVDRIDRLPRSSENKRALLVEVIDRTRNDLIGGLPQIKIGKGGTEEAWRRVFDRYSREMGLFHIR